jgi:hypothetical protein
MSEESLRDLLARVHERLNTSASVDADTRDMLVTVMRDIDSRLGRGANAGQAPSIGRTHASAAPRLEALAVQFEADHPGIAQLLRQISALLGQAGI